MKPTPKALDPAVFLKAAELIDSGEKSFLTFRLFRKAGDNPENFPHLSFLRENFDFIFDGVGGSHRILTLLLCAELCRTVRRSTPRGGKGSERIKYHEQRSTTDRDSAGVWVDNAAVTHVDGLASRRP